MNRWTLKWSVLAVCAMAAGNLAFAGGTMKDSRGSSMKGCDEMMSGNATGKDHGSMMGKDHMGMMGKDMPKDCQEMMENHGMTMGDSAKSAQLAEHPANGTVKSVDTAAGRVTLQHGPIESIGWPAMTMGFAVKDPKQLEGLKPGQAVDFTLVKQGSDYVVTRIK